MRIKRNKDKPIMLAFNKLSYNQINSMRNELRSYFQNKQKDLQNGQHFRVRGCGSTALLGTYSQVTTNLNILNGDLDRRLIAMMWLQYINRRCHISEAMQNLDNAKFFIWSEEIGGAFEIASVTTEHNDGIKQYFAACKEYPGMKVEIHPTSVYTEYTNSDLENYESTPLGAVIEGWRFKLTSLHMPSVKKSEANKESNVVGFDRK